jgi:hypothetical protein
MPKYQKITASKISVRQKKGYGMGSGKDYKPWYTIRSVSSKGNSHRIKGWKTNRVHHLLSNIEAGFFYTLEWADNVSDIRERFPLLPIEKTLEIAEGIGISHPFDRVQKEPIVMTTDFLVTYKTVNGGESLFAFNVLPNGNREKKRILERAVIEKLFWKEQGIKFSFITDKNLSQPLINNMKWIRQSRELEFAPGITNKDVFQAENILFELFREGDIPLREACSTVDKLLNYNNGVALWVVQHLIANKYWSIDINKQIDTLKELEFTRNIEIDDTLDGLTISS